MTEFFASLGPWNWFIFALALFALEAVVPGVHFLWFGVAALVVGGLALASGIAWPWQLIAFGVVAVATVFAVRRFSTPDSAKSDLPDLNVRAHQYVGRIVVVEEAAGGSRARVRVGDTLWQAEGADLQPGTRVKVVGVNGTVLMVERVAA